ncbi:MAG: ABC-F family ATP-binding cassette domain-containing protein, partial [Thermodesulfobacteriota bacterium]
MIRISNISQSFKGKEIFRSLNWNIKKNRKYGLVGPNGTGKTTLLEVISGLLEPESGGISAPKKTVLGYLPQDLNFQIKDNTVVNEALGALSEKTSSDEENIESQRFKAEKILMGLGFSTSQFDEKAVTLSGGWKMRIELAKILLKEPNVLLLDEPTNHLDIQSIEWIEGYLDSFSGTVVMVSHDKYLLDKMIDTVAAIEKGDIREYQGNYSHYLNEKEVIQEVQLSTYKNQQKMIQQTERFIERFRYKNTKAKQVQSRVKMLEKLELIEEPESDQKKIKLKFPEAPRAGRVVYELSEFSKEYITVPENINVVFENSGPLKIERGDKIAIAGKNGEGKTTLAKIIVGLENFNGESSLGHNVELAYYAQDQTDNLNLEKSVYDEFVGAAPQLSDTQIRSILGSFLFNEEDLEKKVKVLSGGEKSRVSLSKMLVSPSNFLV